MDVRYRLLRSRSVSDVPCRPGGVGLTGKTFCDDLTETIDWCRQMIDFGMRGVAGETARGLAEYMPAEAAPMPINAPRPRS